MKNSVGRPRLGAPMSITLTTEQRLWLQARADETGATHSAIVRQLLDDAIQLSPQEYAESRKRIAKIMRELKQA